MKIICLSCGHKVDLGDAYDDYAGAIKCATCGATLEIRTETGGIKAVAVTRLPPLETSAAAAPGPVGTTPSSTPLEAAPRRTPPLAVERSAAVAPVHAAAVERN